MKKIALKTLSLVLPTILLLMCSSLKSDKKTENTISGKNDEKNSKEVLDENSPRISVTPQSLSFKKTEALKTLNIKNIGTGELTYSITTEGTWFDIDKKEGTLKSAVEALLTVKLRDESGTSGKIFIKSNDKNISIQLTIETNEIVTPSVTVSPEPTATNISTADPTPDLTPEVTPSQTATPAETGETLLNSRCTKCHNTDRIIQASKTRNQWEQTITRMLSKGAVLNTEETDLLLDYLFLTYGAF